MLVGVVESGYKKTALNGMRFLDVMLEGYGGDGAYNHLCNHYLINGDAVVTIMIFEMADTVSFARRRNGEPFEKPESIFFIDDWVCSHAGSAGLKWSRGHLDRQVELPMQKRAIREETYDYGERFIVNEMHIGYPGVNRLMLDIYSGATYFGHGEMYISLPTMCRSRWARFIIVDCGIYLSILYKGATRDIDPVQRQLAC